MWTPDDVASVQYKLVHYCTSYEYVALSHFANRSDIVTLCHDVRFVQDVWHMHLGPACLHKASDLSPFNLVCLEEVNATRKSLLGQQL